MKDGTLSAIGDRPQPPPHDSTMERLIAKPSNSPIRLLYGAVFLRDAQEVYSVLRGRSRDS